MAGTLNTLSPAQLEIMQIVWEQGEASVADVWRLLGARRKVARNTVLTLMTRLAKKGWLKCRPDGNSFIYSAAVERRKTLRGLVARLLETAFAGSSEGLVTALLDARNLPPDEAARIRAMIGQAEKNGK